MYPGTTGILTQGLIGPNTQATERLGKKSWLNTAKRSEYQTRTPRMSFERESRFIRSATWIHKVLSKSHTNRIHKKKKKRLMTQPHFPCSTIVNDQEGIMEKSSTPKEWHNFNNTSHSTRSNRPLRFPKILNITCCQFYNNWESALHRVIFLWRAELYLYKRLAKRAKRTTILASFLLET